MAKHVAIWKLTVCASLVASVSLAACFFGNSMPFLVVFLGILHGKYQATETVAATL